MNLSLLINDQSLSTLQVLPRLDQRRVGGQNTRLPVHWASSWECFCCAGCRSFYGIYALQLQLTFFPLRSFIINQYPLFTFQVCNNIAVRRGLSMPRYRYCHFVLDWILQFDTESPYLCIFQSGFSGGFQEHLEIIDTMCCQEESLQRSQCLLCIAFTQ